MSIFQKLYIKQKLSLIILVISSIALLLACAVFIIYDYITYKHVMKQKLQTLGEIVGNHCQAALIFDNSNDARETLATLLKAEKHIVFASIYDKNDKIFAKYKRDDLNPGYLPVTSKTDTCFFIKNYLVLFRGINIEEDKIGNVYIRSNLGEIRTRLKRYTGIVLFVLGMSILTSYLITAKLQQFISDPILHLANIAREVSLRKDYTIRAKKTSMDELGFLTERFNEMLMQIQNQNVALQKAHHELEIRAQELQSELVVRKRAENQIKASLKEKEVLLREIHHRVKNNLQIISSLLNLQFKQAKDPKAMGMLTESQNRISSIALIHEKLYQSKDIVKIDFSDYIKSLTRNLLTSYGVSLGTIKIDINIGKVSLSIDKAIPCGLIINELISNSLKYAFPKNGRGDIKIQLALNNENKVILTIHDNGIGFPPNFDYKNTETLGLQLVNTLTEQLKGSIELNNKSGAEFKLVFPC
jgi:two-component sensor histidine kinase